MEYLISRRKISGTPPRPTGVIAKQTNFLKIQPAGQKIATCNVIAAKKWVAEVAQTAKDNSVLIVVHGFNVLQHSFTHEVASVRSRLTAKGFKGAIVGFDWPADGGILKYWSDWSDAGDIAKFLIADGIGTILRHRPNSRFHLLCHSMGSYVVSAALRDAWNDPQTRPLTRKIDEVVMTAPDIDLEWTKAGGWVRQMPTRSCSRMTYYCSDRDQVLQFSENNAHPGTKRLGRHVQSASVDKDFVAIDCIPYYTNHVSRWPRLRKSHNWYYRNADFYADALDTLRGRSQTLQRAKIANGHYRFRRP
ncbi:MAG: alpha/beta fold hydrolase [Pseudomonadota bacterium]